MSLKLIYEHASREAEVRTHTNDMFKLYHGDDDPDYLHLSLRSSDGRLSGVRISRREFFELFKAIDHTTSYVPKRRMA